MSKSRGTAGCVFDGIRFSTRAFVCNISYYTIVNNNYYLCSVYKRNFFVFTKKFTAASIVFYVPSFVVINRADYFLHAFNFQYFQSPIQLVRKMKNLFEKTFVDKRSTIRVGVICRFSVVFHSF